MPVTLVHGALFQIAPQRLGNHLAHLQRRAAGRIYLVAVVRFNDFNVITLRQRLGSHLQQLESNIHPHTHIGRHHNGNVFGCIGNLGFLRLAKTCCANHHIHAQLATSSQMLQRAFRAGKVNQRVCASQALCKVRRHQHTARLARKCAGITAQQGAISTVKSAMQHAIISRSNCLNQHLPHAPTSANHCDADIFSNSTHCGNGA